MSAVQQRPGQQRPVKIEEIPREDRLLGGLAALLALDLLFLPWNQIVIALRAQSISISSTATGAPEGWLGVLALLATLALLADVVLAWVSPHVKPPALKGGRDATRIVLARLAVGLLAFKLLLHLGSAGGLGFWGAVVFGGALLYVTRRAPRARAAKG